MLPTDVTDMQCVHKVSLPVSNVQLVKLSKKYSLTNYKFLQTSPLVIEQKRAVCKNSMQRKKNGSVELGIRTFYI